MMDVVVGVSDENWAWVVGNSDLGHASKLIVKSSACVLQEQEVLHSERRVCSHMAPMSKVQRKIQMVLELSMERVGLMIENEEEQKNWGDRSSVRVRT